MSYKGGFFTNRLSTMMSAYTIDCTSILAPDPSTTNPNRQSVVPGTRSRGIELTVQGNLKNVTMIGWYACNNHVLLSNSSIGKAGFRYVNAPNYIANAFINYIFTGELLKGTGIGIGGRYTSDQIGNLSNQNFIVPASTVLDAVVNYAVQRVNTQLNVYNLTNARYFNGGLSRNTVASLGNPINFRVGLSYLTY